MVGYTDDPDYNPFSDPAFGAIAAQDPHQAAMHLAQAGIAPPSQGQSLFDVVAPVDRSSPFNIRNYFKTNILGDGGDPKTPSEPPTPPAVHSTPDVLAPLTGATDERTQNPNIPPSSSAATTMSATPVRPAAGAPLSLNPNDYGGSTTQPSTQQKTQQLASSLRGISGVQAPAAPEVQKISSPHVPVMPQSPQAMALTAFLTQASQGQQNTTSPILRLAQALQGVR